MKTGIAFVIFAAIVGSGVLLTSCDKAFDVLSESQNSDYNQLLREGREAAAELESEMEDLQEEWGQEMQQEMQGTQKQLEDNWEQEMQEATQQIEDAMDQANNYEY